MLLTDILLEHSRWIRDPYYTKDRESVLHKATIAVKNAYSGWGIYLDFRKHFFDQLVLQRGMSRIEPDMIMAAFAKIKTKGLHLFRNKPEGTEFIFYDPVTNLNIPFIKTGDNSYRLPTVVRDTRYLGPGQKINLH